MTKSCELHPTPSRGAATLLLVALLLMSAALLVFYAARVGMTEQRLIANDVLAHEAGAAAQAGLEHAFDMLTGLDATTLPFDGEGRFVLDGPTAALDNGARYSTRVHNHGLTPGDATLLHIESLGAASDGIGVRTIRQLARHDPWLAHPPPVPLITRGDAVLAADAVLRNPDGPAAWSGGGLTAPVSALIEFAASAACPADGICAGDGRLAAMSDNAFLANFFGRPAVSLRARALRLTCTACAADVLATSDGQPSWIDSSDDTVVVAGGAAGTPESPVILIIDGDLEIAADASVHGLVYVRGDWRPGAGALAVSGAVIVAGAVREPRFVLDYDAVVLERLTTRGPYARVAGSWIDF